MFSQPTAAAARDESHFKELFGLRHVRPWIESRALNRVQGSFACS